MNPVRVLLVLVAITASIGGPGGTLFRPAGALTEALQASARAAAGARMAWWREARFGMFIHWGLYAVPAGEWKGRTDYGEWIRNNAQHPASPSYDKFRRAVQSRRGSTPTAWVAHRQGRRA